MNSCGMAKSECILMGDFNTDASNKSCPTYRAFIRFSKLFDLKQLIKEPTRIGQTTPTIIDLILVVSQMNVTYYNKVELHMGSVTISSPIVPGKFRGKLFQAIHLLKLDPSELLHREF